MSMKEKYYLVILGDIDNSHFDKMLSRLDIFSEKKKIFNNLFICKDTENTDNACILLRYENGSNAVINYFANGSKSYDKERVEVYSQERVLVLENWRKLKGYGVKGFSKMSGSLNKGQEDEFKMLNDRIVNGGDALIPFDSIINTTKASFAAIQSLRERKWIDLED